MSTRNRLEFTNPDAGLADDFMPGNTGLMIHLCLAYIRLDCASSINLDRAGVDTGLAESAAACTEVEIGQTGHFVFSRVQINDGRFTGRSAGVSAVSAELV